MDLDTRLTELYNELGDMQGNLNDNGAIGQVYNALLDEIKQQHGDDPVVSRIDPVGFTMGGHTALTAESLRAVVGQLRAVLRGD
jgi:hypothetical protein